MSTNITATVVAFGVPALLIVLGFLAVLQAEVMEAIGIDSSISGIGALLIGLGVLIYLLEILLIYQDSR